MDNRTLRSKNCRFCEAKVSAVDYKDVKTLRAYVTERGKMISRRVSGSCARHHRMVDRAIQHARNIALLPFADD